MRHQRHRKNGGVPPFIDPAFAEALAGSSETSYRQRNRQHEHKAKQLCRQVQHALNLSLAGECNDDVLRDAYVVDVTPAPDAGHLAVHVTTSPDVGMADLLERLARATPLLRMHVARAITRKRAPELMFVPAMPSASRHDESAEVEP